jgi:hypothetical protein
LFEGTPRAVPDKLDGGGPAAAAGTRVPAKVWLGLINK